MEPDALMIKMDAVTFSKRLKEARLAAGLTQQQLADACGISDRTVSAWETGTAEGILAENLFSVADYMRVDPRWLATGEAVDVSGGSSVGEIIRSLKDMTPEQQQAILGLVKTLKR